MKRLILASASEARAKLLVEAGYKFSTISADIDEAALTANSPKALVQKIAKAKMASLGEQFSGSNSVVITADTLIEFEGKVLGKPKTEANALEMLKKLSGKSHLAHTGWVVRDFSKSKEFSGAVSTKVYFKELREAKIMEYIENNLDNITSRAGGYAYQGEGSKFVEKIEGDKNNLIGLPLSLVEPKLILVGLSREK